MFSQRKFGCLAAILTVFAAGSAARAAEPVSLQFDFSVPPRHVVAEVTNTTASPRYDFGKTTEQLSRILSGDDLKLTGNVRGVTRQAMTTLIRLTYRPAGTVNGEEQVAITKIQYSIGYTAVDVYVQAYPVGSCERVEVLHHENLHVGIASQTLDRAMPTIQAAVQRVADEMPSAVAKDGLMAAVQARVTAATGPAIRTMLADRADFDTALDSPASYRMTQNRCSNW